MNNLMKAELQPEVVRQANSLTIKNNIDYTAAYETLKRNKLGESKVKGVMDPICEAANKAHKKATTTRKENLQPYTEANKIIKEKMIEYAGENEVQKVEGISYRQKWTATVMDFKKLPDEFKITDQKALDKIATASAGLLPIPGVEFKLEKNISLKI